MCDPQGVATHRLRITGLGFGKTHLLTVPHVSEDPEFGSSWGEWVRGLGSGNPSD